MSKDSVLGDPWPSNMVNELIHVSKLKDSIFTIFIDPSEAN